MLVAEVAENERPDRPCNVTDTERGKGRHDADLRIVTDGKKSVGNISDAACA